MSATAYSAVLVVSNNPETLDGLARYLRGAGIAVRGTRALDEAARLGSRSRTAVVVFPDDYPPPKVRATLAHLKEKDVLTVLVTSDLRAFSTTNTLVLPKPAWGWTILDAIRDAFVESSGA
ncbi:MAG TPA: hypothetical protein VGH87_25735 [Polyangiaceae bacterium]|jgi:DNA-binding response OmpR family regulator